MRPSFGVCSILALIFALFTVGALAGCGASPITFSEGGAAAGKAEGTTAGPTYVKPTSVVTATFNASRAQAAGSGLIDISSSSQGYVGASITNPSKCKFQVIKDSMTYNYDIPSDGTPIIVPMNMGSGTYTFCLMQNTTGSSYIEVGSITADVKLESDFAPYLHPDIFCQYTSNSACVKQAYALASGCENEGDVTRAIYNWMVESISYDTVKASELANAAEYVPMPDDTLATGTGICFDYASLAAAMFRSLGIPCQIITGYVGKDDLYHAWNMIYIDGEWVSAQITIQPNTWCRVDLTFAAANGGNTTYVGDGTTYTDRYVY